MKFGSGARARRSDADINVTSLVDVIFNLLLFFVLSTQFSQSSGLAVELPRASSADAATTPQDLIVALTKDGQLVVNGRAVTKDDLDAELAAFQKAQPRGLVVVQADQDVPHGGVVDVIDRAKAKGLARVVIATQE
jgi:biopolymer transport protein ExbD